MNRDPLTVAVVGATGVVGRTMIQILNEREFPVGELRLLASGRSAGRTVSIDGRTLEIGEAVPDAFEGVDIALFSAGADVSTRARTRRGRSRRDRHRQLVGLADGPDDPARRLAGQSGRPRGPPGHRRQPELLDDAAGAGPDGAARHGRARAGRRRHLPVRVGHRRRRPRRAREARSARTSPARRRSRASIRTRSPSTRCPRSTSSSTTATPRRSGRSSPRTARSCTCRTCASRARPSGSRSSSATPRRSTSRPASRSPRERARDAVRRRARASSSRTTRPAHRYPLATEAAGRDEIFVGRVRRDVVDRGRPRARVLGRLGQPAQGRGHERRRARRAAARARLGPSRGRPGRAPYTRSEPPTAWTPPRPRRDRRRAPRGARGDRCRGPSLHELPSARDPDEGRPGRGRPGDRGRLRRRRAGLQRGPSGAPVRRPSGRPAGQAPRLDRLAA